MQYVEIGHPLAIAHGSVFGPEALGEGIVIFDVIVIVFFRVLLLRATSRDLSPRLEEVLEEGIDLLDRPFPTFVVPRRGIIARVGIVIVIVIVIAPILLRHAPLDEYSKFE
jgi:hypothetical protein